LQEALDAVGEGDSPLRATMLARLAGQAIYSGWSREQTGMLARQAVEMARRLRDPATLGAALHAHHAALRGAREHPRARLPVATELIELGARSGDRELALWGHIRRVTDLLELGDRPALEAEAEVFTRLTEQLRLPAYQWWPALWKTMLALLEGRLQEVEQLALEALAIGQAGQGEAALQHYGAQLFLLRREQKRLGELEEAIRTAVEENPQLPAWRCALAHLYAELGREEEARAEFELLAANEFRGVLEDFNWGIVGPGLAQVCAFLSDTERARRLYELLLPVADRCAFVGWAALCAGAVSRYLGLLATTLGRWEEAQAHFEDALVRNAKLGSRPLVAHTQHWYARMFLARGMPGDLERALDLLARSTNVAEELGMVCLADQAGAAKAEAEAVVSG
jgi:tetratricopeptide (TPR) repeat protein